jgi:hypothetical protein
MLELLPGVSMSTRSSIPKATWRSSIRPSPTTGGPDWAPSAIFNGSFGGPAPTLTLTNTIISGNQWYACDHWTGANILISGGNNLIQDDSCNLVTSDVIIRDALIGPLADNGGPTFTHALLSGSPATDTADDAFCTGTDQRGITRPQGMHCDVGSFELSIP